MITIHELKFYEDSGHGWLAVKHELLAKLGIADKISTYSYMNGGMAYLEEDCDADTFCKAMDSHGLKYEFIRVNHGSRSPIRGYHRYLELLPLNESA